MSWISVNIQAADYPYYDYKAKKVITDKAAGLGFLDKLKNHGRNPV